MQGYGAAFAKAFRPEGVTDQNIVKAIATYVRTFVAGDTPAAAESLQAQGRELVAVMSFFKLVEAPQTSAPAMPRGEPAAAVRAPAPARPAPAGRAPAMTPKAPSPAPAAVADVTAGGDNWESL